MSQLRLRFFDVDVSVRADSPEFIELFSTMYGRFIIGELARGVAQAAKSSLEFTFFSRTGSMEAESRLVMNGEEIPIPLEPTLAEGFAQEAILNEVIAGVRSHFLVHASVVSKEGNGIILAGDSGHGKTTLALELVRRGFSFLSDELAALSRADGLVHPFPRALRIRPSSLSMLALQDQVKICGARQWLDKLLLDIAQLWPDRLGGQASVSHIVLLRDSLVGSIGDRGSGQKVEFLVDRLDGDLVQPIRSIPGVDGVETGWDRGFPLVSVNAWDRTSLIDQVETLCRKRKVLVLDIVKRHETPANFGSRAILEPIPKSQAVVALLSLFQGGHKSALLRHEFAGSPSRLYLSLARLTAGASCHQLLVGPLAEMADLVAELVDNSRPGN